MIDLSELAGFPLTLSDDGDLKFGPGVVAPSFHITKPSNMSDVLLYPEQKGPEILYKTYKSTGLESDKIAMMNEGLQYNIAVIYPGTIGSEYVKTFGHYHSMAPGRLYSYPAIYQVMHGTAHFLMQKGGVLTGEVENFVIADFQKGDILLIPPFYGHAIVNPGSKPLAISSWVAKNSNPIYDAIRARKGIAYYNVKHKDQSIFMPNDRYVGHPKPELQNSKGVPEFGLYKLKSIYTSWQESADLNFLVNPNIYAKFWKSMGIASAQD